jgi:hypothetical protein
MTCILQCSACGESYTARRKTDPCFCRNCKVKAQLDRNVKYRMRKKEVKSTLYQAVERKVIGLTVVLDPLERCGFAAGTYFPHDEWVGMLKYRSFTPGTILRDCDGRLYKA